MDFMLQALLEAAKDEKEKEKKNRQAGNEDEGEEDAEEQNTREADTEPANDTADEEDAPAEEEPEAAEADAEAEEPADDAEDAGQEEDAPDAEEGDDTNPDEGGEDAGGEDDFNVDPEGGDAGGEGEDNEPPPDGLTDPDDDGSNDGPEEEEETNVQINVLQLTKLDRLLNKKRIFSDFQDLRTSVRTFRNIVTTNAENIDPDERDVVLDRLDRLFNQITDYLTYKFSFIGYEENLNNYMIFTKAMEDIVSILDKEKSKKSLIKSKIKKETTKQ